MSNNTCWKGGVVMIIGGLLFLTLSLVTAEGTPHYATRSIAFGILAVAFFLADATRGYVRTS